MNYKQACQLSWGLVLLVALGVLMFVNAMGIDLSGYILSMMGV